MPKENKQKRISVSLSAQVEKRVKAIAKTRNTSSSRVLVDLIETGLEAKNAEKDRFFALAGKLSETEDTGERERIKKELARMTFGG
jgi:predicted transcriptional regulator